MWVEKYRPKQVDEVIGNESAKLEFIEWVKLWKKGKTRELGILLVGPAGIGKTSWVHAFANTFGYVVIETNASDYRSKKALEDRLGHLYKASTLDSFMGKGRREPLLFLDEVDGIDPKADSGAIPTLISIIKSSRILTVLAANVLDQKQHKLLIENFKIINFNPLTPRQIIILLKRILYLEGATVENQVLNDIAVKSKGDARAAINMLQAVLMGISIGSMGITIENLPYDVLLKRLSEAVDKGEVSMLIQSNLNYLEDLIETISDSINRSGLDIKLTALLLNELSELDMMWRRINRERKWSLLKYFIPNISDFIFKLKKYISFEPRITEYRFQLFIRNRKVREQREEMLNLLSNTFHLSKRKFMTEVLPYRYNELVIDEWRDLQKWCSRMYG
jgi:replication factor C large subunit